MSVIDHETPALSSRAGTFWALVPVILLGAALAGLGTMAAIATRDPGFALETDYYQRAVHWNDQQAQWRENERLGYGLTLTLNSEAELTVALRKRDGTPLCGAKLSAEAFPNARAGLRQKLEFVESLDGTYRAALTHARPGLWEFRFSALTDGGRFTRVERADVARTQVAR